MNSLESALKMFHEHPFYRTITLPERFRINQLIQQVFEARPKPIHIGQLEIYRYAPQSLSGKNFTVISFTSQPFTINLVDTRVSRWNLESGDGSKMIRYDKNTEAVVMVETDPNHVKAVSIDHGKDDTELSYLGWNSVDPHPDIIREKHSSVDEMHFLFRMGIVWDDITDELEAAQRIERTFLDPTNWVITKISDLSGQFHISKYDLVANPEFKPLKIHLYYLLSEVNTGKGLACSLNCCQDRQ